MHTVHILPNRTRSHFRFTVSSQDVFSKCKVYPLMCYISLEFLSRRYLVPNPYNLSTKSSKLRILGHPGTIGNIRGNIGKYCTDHLTTIPINLENDKGWVYVRHKGSGCILSGREQRLIDKRIRPDRLFFFIESS